METPQNPKPPVTLIPNANVDTHSYRGWLNSDRFYKRALAVLGYSIVGQLLFALMIIVISMGIGTIAGLASFIM